MSGNSNGSSPPRHNPDLGLCAMDIGTGGTVDSGTTDCADDTDFSTNEAARKFRRPVRRKRWRESGVEVVSAVATIIYAYFLIF